MAKRDFPNFVFPTNEVAMFFDVTPRTIQIWAKNGMPRVKHGFFDLKQCFRWFLDNIAEEKRPEKAVEMSDVKVDYWQAKADRERLRFEHEKGKLIDRDRVQKSWAKRVAILFSALEGMKQRLPPILSGKSRLDMQSLISDEISEMQSSLFHKFDDYGPVRMKPTKGGKWKKRKKQSEVTQSQKSNSKNLKKNGKKGSRKSTAKSKQSIAN